MPQLGRFSETVINTTGDAVSGASVNIYRRGATANGSSSGTSPLTVTVNHPGRILANDTVIIDGGATSYTVDSISDTTVVLSGFAGTLAVSDDQRLTPTNSQPTLYVDAFAGETTSNPITTSSLGAANAWLGTGFVDAIISGSGINTVVRPDVLVLGQDDRVNVQWFGALGDNSTNDTTAIQAAINYVYNRDLGIVWFPPGIYKASTINWKTGISLLGSGMNPSPHGNGTVLQQISGSNVDFITSDTALAATDHQHWCRISDMRLLGNSGDTIGSGIKFNSRTGEGTKFERLHIASFPESGIEIVEGCVPMYTEDIHVFRNGLYGIDINVTGSTGPSQTIKLTMTSGDDNGTALIRLKTSSGLTQGQAYIIDGVKAEKHTSGKQDDAIVLDTMNGTPVLVIGVGAINNSGQVANSVIKVIGASCRLTWISVNGDSNYTYTVDDQFGTRTFAGATSTSGSLDFGSPTISRLILRSDLGTLTIATGAITVAGSSYAVDTEAAAASDDLDTISGGITGQLLVLRAANDGRTVVIKDGTGNIRTPGDFSLDNSQDRWTGIYDGTNWCEIARSDNTA